VIDGLWTAWFGGGGTEVTFTRVSSSTNERESLNTLAAADVKNNRTPSTLQPVVVTTDEQVCQCW